MSFDRLPGLAYQPLFFHAVEHLHAEIAREVIVADPRAAQGGILWPGANAHVTGARRQTGEPFDHAGDVGAGESVITVTALFFQLDQAAGFELRQM